MRVLQATTPVALVIVLVSVAWCAVVGAGFFVMQRYSTTPGEQAPAAVLWPQDSHVERRPGSYNLVMALHPRCPCSHASVAELERILVAAPENTRVHVLAYQPSAPAADDDWRDSELLRRVGRIPGVYLHLDQDAEEAERFGARTSGQVALYGPGGELLFHGGITSARGHEGDSAAHPILRALLGGERPPPTTTPVYGCPLHALIANRCNNEK
jgi:hypothetical protein